MINRVDRKSQIECLKQCGELLKRGASVLFFPEGTRSKDGKMQPFKKVGGVPRFTRGDEAHSFGFQLVIL